MSRTPADISFDVVRGSTWEDSIAYLQDDEETPVNLTGYEARLQVRTIDGQYGTSQDSTLLLNLSTEDGTLTWHNGDPATGKVVIEVAPADHAALNPDNEKREKYALWVEVYQPAAGEDPEYVVPLAKGRVTVHGRGYRPVED